MGFSGALLALTAVQGVAQIGQGYAKSTEAKANASIVEGQNQLLQVQGDITQGQFTRKAGQLLSSQTATAGAAGYQPTGSAAAVMLDSQTQIHTDMAIANFNNKTSQNYNTQQADALRRQAKQDVSTGYSNAFSTMLTGASNYALYNQKKSFNLNAGAGK